MSQKNKEENTPKEIPSHKHPNQQPPLKDPLSPNENNPINPMDDEAPGERD